MTHLVKLNVEMNMADLIGKVVRKSTARRASMPSADIMHPQLRMQGAGRERLGSKAKAGVMPVGNNGDSHTHHNHSLTLHGDEEGSSSGAQGGVGGFDAELPGWPGSWVPDEERDIGSIARGNI